MILAFSGLAGVGKDTAASFLQDRFLQVALADEMKRICSKLFGFTYDQLWGPSENRNKPDRRYVRLSPADLAWVDDAIEEWHKAEDVKVPIHEFLGFTWPEYADWVETGRIHLTPRWALQQLGTEWGRAAYENLWVDQALKACRALEQDPTGTYYDRLQGAYKLYQGETVPPREGVVLTDIRFLNEVEAIRREGGKVIRIIRPIQGDAVAASHASEAGQLLIPDALFDEVIHNDGTIEQFREKVLNLNCLKG